MEHSDRAKITISLKRIQLHTQYFMDSILYTYTPVIRNLKTLESLER